MSEQIEREPIEINCRVWNDFIERWYPDYDHADEIAWNGDLCKLAMKEYEEGDCAHELLKDEYNNDIDNPQIVIDYNRDLIKIYERAIENYLDQTV